MDAFITVASAAESFPTSVLPYLTGAGGCVVALALGNFFWLKGKIISASTLDALRQADADRLNDMRERLSDALSALEQANHAAETSAEVGRSALELLRQSGGPRV